MQEKINQIKTYQRLLNYHYKEDYSKPQKLKHIEKHATKIKTPQLTNQKGWVLTEHIEKIPTPYDNPPKKRYLYLNNEHIEKTKFEYIERVGQRKYHKRDAVFRLKPTIKTLKTMFILFAEQQNYSFFASDYYNDNKQLLEKTETKFYQKILSKKIPTHQLEGMRMRLQFFPLLFAAYLKDPDRFEGSFNTISDFMQPHTHRNPMLMLDVITYSTVMTNYIQQTLNNPMFQQKETFEKILSRLFESIKNGLAPNTITDYLTEQNLDKLTRQKITKMEVEKQN